MTLGVWCRCRRTSNGPPDRTVRRKWLIVAFRERLLRGLRPLRPSPALGVALRAINFKILDYGAIDLAT
jgi:hypothetical protein